ncbi:MAG: ABC transporter permease [Chloroflexi bacterium]|nr:ABC transporter permease [Chloroflexota bacterium]
MTLYVRLAWRNIWRHKRRTVIIVVAMGLALAMMMMYDGLVDGFNNAIYGNAIRVLGGNIQVRADGYREKVESNPLIPLPNDEAVIQEALTHPDVTAAFRRIQTGGMLSNREGAFPLSIVGIEPEAEAPISLIEENVVEGRWLTGTDEDLLLVGRGLADVMDIQVGDRLTIVGSDSHKQNRQRTMTVVGIYDLGMPTIEKQTVYISLAEAQSLFDLRGQSTEVQINLKDLGGEDLVVDALVPALPGYEVASWAENYPELSTAITSKNFVMDIFSVIIQLIAGIGVLNLLLMAVFERTREIGLLGAMGLKPRQIATLFILEGTMIGIVGVIAGILFGVTFNAGFGQVGFDYSSFAGVADYMALISGRVYPSLGLGKIIPRAVTVLIITTLAAWIPAREASHREPAQALHYV